MTRPFRQRTLAGVLAAALLVLAAPPALAAPLSGTVTMGTAGSALPDGLRVTVLQTDDQGRPAGEPNHVPVGTAGEFSFEADPQTGHLIGLFHQGVTYSQILEPGHTGEISLPIFETTQDPSVVQVRSDSITVLQSTADGQTDVLEILQLLRFANTSDRAFIGSDADQTPDTEGRQVLKLPLPESAYDLAPADGANNAGLATVGPRLVTASALVPGEASVAYLYKVRVPRTGWQLRREVYHPTDHADLLIGGDLRLTAAPGFTFAETTTLGGVEYLRYRSGGLNPGSVIEADVGFPEVDATGMWWGFGALVVIIAAAFGFGSMRLRRRRAQEAGGPAAQPAPETADNRPERRELIEQVAALDESFEAGEVAEEDYRQRRSRLLEELTRTSPAG